MLGYFFYLKIGRSVFKKDKNQFIYLFPVSELIITKEIKYEWIQRNNVQR